MNTTIYLRNPILQLSTSTFFDKESTGNRFTKGDDGGSLGHIQFLFDILAENITILFKSLKDDIFPIWFALTFISAVDNSL